MQHSENLSSSTFNQPTSITEFDFKLPGILYRGTMPYGIKDDRSIITNMKAKHIAYIVLLCESDECRSSTYLDLKDLYQKEGFTVIHFPIRDFSAPNVENLRSLVDQMYEILATNGKDHNLLIHCKGGKGRTGMVIACLARKVFNYNAEEATRWVRNTLPGAVEVRSQHEAIQKFMQEQKPLSPVANLLPDDNGRPQHSAAPEIQPARMDVPVPISKDPSPVNISVAPAADKKSHLFTSLINLVICCKNKEKTSKEVV